MREWPQIRSTAAEGQPPFSNIRGTGNSVESSRGTGGTEFACAERRERGRHMPAPAPSHVGGTQLRIGCFMRTSGVSPLSIPPAVDRIGLPALDRSGAIAEREWRGAKRRCHLPPAGCCCRRRPLPGGHTPVTGRSRRPRRSFRRGGRDQGQGCRGTGAPRGEESLRPVAGDPGSGRGDGGRGRTGGLGESAGHARPRSSRGAGLRRPPDSSGAATATAAGAQSERLRLPPVSRRQGYPRDHLGPPTGADSADRAAPRAFGLHRGRPPYTEQHSPRFPGRHVRGAGRVAAGPAAGGEIPHSAGGAGQLQDYGTRPCPRYQRTARGAGHRLFFHRPEALPPAGPTGIRDDRGGAGSLRLRYRAAATGGACHHHGDSRPGRTHGRQTGRSLQLAGTGSPRHSVAVAR